MLIALYSVNALLFLPRSFTSGIIISTVERDLNKRERKRRGEGEEPGEDEENAKRLRKLN